MAGLGDLVVNLSANTQKFEKGIGKAQSGLKSFSSSAMSFINPITAGFAAMAVGAVGVGAAVWGLQSRIGDLAGVADKAAQTGLSGAFLQQLEFAADQSGVSAETLTGGIKKLTVIIGKAAEGSKEASESLKSLGLSAKDLQSLSPEQQFMKISEAIGKIPTASGRAAAAVKVFGKSGIEMTTLFAGGLDDITKLMQDARDIGIGLDAESLAQVAEADDALQKMYASIGAMVDQVAVGLAPAFTEVSTKVTELIGPVTKLFAAFNSLGDAKWKFAGELMVAGFDVGMETIKLHWADMLNDMLDQVAKIDWKQLLNPFASIKISDLRPDAKPQNLNEAQGRLNALMGKLNEAQVKNDAAANAPPKAGPQIEGTKGIASMFEKLKDSPLMGTIDSLKMGAEGMIDRAKIQMGAIGGTLTGWLGTDRKKQDMTPRLAGAMQGGSVDAYSTIVQAMMTRGKDPVVAATEKQTRDLIKGLKPKREFKNIDSFVGL